VDASGELLHRRGWRVEAGPAPLRETLAAGLLALCEYDPALPLVDPMCGSGTIAIEAAALAHRIPPGIGRSFAFERWPIHDAQIWRQVRDVELGPGRALAPIVASDRDERAVEIARRNADRAKVDGDIRFFVASLGDHEIPEIPGLVALNPPYGRRLGQGQPSHRMARGLGQTLGARFAGWRAAVLCPAAAFVAAISAGVRRQPERTFALRNGGLRVQLALWRL
jgi:putative N6-adenine-specific DNA methylase